MLRTNTHPELYLQTKLTQLRSSADGSSHRGMSCTVHLPSIPPAWWDRSLCSHKHEARNTQLWGGARYPSTQRESLASHQQMEPRVLHLHCTLSPEAAPPAPSTLLLLPPQSSEEKSRKHMKTHLCSAWCSETQV